MTRTNPNAARDAARARSLDGHNEYVPVVLTARLDDLLLRDEHPLESHWESRTLGHPSHYRIQPPQSFGSGFLEMCGIADGFYVMVSDLRYNEPCPIVTRAADFLHIRIASDLDTETAPEDESHVRIAGPGVTIGLNPTDASPGRGVLSGHNHLVHVLVHRDALCRLWPGDEADLPPIIQAFAAGELTEKFLRCFTLGPSFLRCLEDFHGCRLEGLSRRLFIQGKAIEVLGHAFALLAGGDEADASADEASATTTRCVLKAQQLLAANFVAPPSLEDLAQQVGLSRTALCVGFRQVVGRTVFDHIGDLRIQQALKLLTEGRESIAEIAHSVGFSHTSSFSNAVQRRLGMSPSEVRRRADVRR